MTPFLIDPELPARIHPPVPPALFGLPVRTLDIASHWHSPATGALLAAEIGRTPRNLHTHMQRVALWASLDQPLEVACAVVDLWIVLGPCGRDLRARLLARHRDALDEHRVADHLAEHLEQGIDSHAPCLALPGTVLAQPVEGHRSFVRAARSWESAS